MSRVKQKERSERIKQGLYKNLYIEEKKIIIIGASGHGKVIANIANLKGYNEILFLDDDISKKDCGQYKVVGTSEKIDSFIKQGYDFAIAIGNNESRKKIYKKLIDKKASVPSLVHPTAVIGDTVKIGNGTVIMANCVINAGSVIGNACIINTSSTIDHDCNIHDYVHVSPGVHIAGTVEIGNYSWIGIGSSIINNIKICNDCILGAGSVVIKDIFNCGTYVGVPTKKVK